MFPPGRARLATSSGPNRIGSVRHDDRNDSCQGLGSLGGGRAGHDEEVDLETDQLGCELGEIFVPPGRHMAFLDEDRLALNISDVLQTLAKGGEPGVVVFGGESGQIADLRNLPRRLRLILLRAGRGGEGRQPRDEARDETAT